MLRLPLMRFERAVEHRQMLRLQAALHGRAVFLDVFNRVEFFDVGDDVLDFRLAVTEPAQARPARRD